MYRSPTDTIILTGLDSTHLKDPTHIVNFLSRSKREIELVALPKFNRILLLCKSRPESELIYNDLMEWKASNPENIKFNVSYSLRDNDLGRSKATSDTVVDYLELPSEHDTKRFLISPPLSPPVEWDHWHKVEEGPNKQTFHSPAELSHLLWERLGGLSESNDGDEEDSHSPAPDRVRKFDAGHGNANFSEPVHDLNKEPEILFKDIDNGVPAIVLESVSSSADNIPKKPIAKTSMPPMDPEY